MDHAVLMVPGLGNSDEGHWQSIWEGESSNYRRVMQNNWDKPDLNEWLKSLSAAIRTVEAPLFLVTHSVGCALVAHWAMRQSSTVIDSSPVMGALLVSPADVDDHENMPSEIAGFAPMPLSPLGFPSIVTASNDDPYVTEERARFFAEQWHSDFFSAGSKGHITTTSGYGEWPDGRKILNRFIATQMNQ